jgi:hypothetical protein
VTTSGYTITTNGYPVITSNGYTLPPRLGDSSLETEIAHHHSQQQQQLHHHQPPPNMAEPPPGHPSFPLMLPPAIMGPPPGLMSPTAPAQQQQQPLYSTPLKEVEVVGGAVVRRGSQEQLELDISNMSIQDTAEPSHQVRPDLIGYPVTLLISVPDLNLIRIQATSPPPPPIKSKKGKIIKISCRAACSRRNLEAFLKLGSPLPLPLKNRYVAIAIFGKLIGLEVFVHCKFLDFFIFSSVPDPSRSASNWSPGSVIQFFFFLKNLLMDPLH